MTSSSPCCWGGVVCDGAAVCAAATVESMHAERSKDRAFLMEMGSLVCCCVRRGAKS
jgi:hypothetical protein